MKAERNKILEPKLPPDTVYDGQTVINLCGQGVINVMACDQIKDGFDPTLYQDRQVIQWPKLSREIAG